MLKKPDDGAQDEGDETAGDHGGQDGPPVVVGELGGGQCSDPGEGDLAQPEHAAFSGDDRP